MAVARTRTRRRRSCALLRALLGAATIGLPLLPSVARAQNATSATNQAAAEALFDQGKAAMAAKDYAAACPRFFESNRLDEGIGTSLWLADCYEKNGQTASAWAQFREAAALAVKSGDPREKVARKRAQALEGHLAHLVVAVPAGSHLPGLHIARDGGEVGAPLWGTSVPIDPGRHTVVVSAPDHRPETLSVDIHPGPGEQTLDVPVLADAPSPPEAPPGEDTRVGAAPPPEPASARMPKQRVAAIAAGAAAVVSVGVATYFGLEASSDLDASNGPGHCSANNVCNATGVSDRSSAESAATVSTVLFVVGAAALAGGVVLWLTTPKPAPAAPDAGSAHPSATLSPWLDPRAGAGGVVLGAEF